MPTGESHNTNLQTELKAICLVRSVTQTDFSSMTKDEQQQADTVERSLLSFRSIKTYRQTKHRTRVSCTWKKQLRKKKEGGKKIGKRR